VVEVSGLLERGMNFAKILFLQKNNREVVVKISRIVAWVLICFEKQKPMAAKPDA
jgi:hypothetical protein